MEEYKYFVRLLTPGNEMAEEIDERINAGWRRCGQCRNLLKRSENTHVSEKEDRGYNYHRCGMEQKTSKE